MRRWIIAILVALLVASTLALPAGACTKPGGGGGGTGTCSVDR